MKQKRIFSYCLAFILPVLCLLILFAVRGIYPLGPISNMVADMEIQYADYFAWYRDVLTGNASGQYSFSMSLGMPTMAFIGYYLSSPINLIVLLFQKSQMQLCFFFISAIKLGLSGLFFYIYINKRFRLSDLPALLLSLAYSFGQYNVGQMTNILWLDGVYMLPLILLGVWRWVEKRRGGMLALTVAASIVFNWYTAYMNCLFAGLYFLFETARTPKNCRKSAGIKNIAGFTGSMLWGIALSAALFLPVVLGQMRGRSTSLAIDVLTPFNNGLADVISGLHIGQMHPSWKVTIFCSVWALLAFFALWFSHAVSLREKLSCAALVGIMIFSECYPPLGVIWCGFRAVRSYAYRFHYLLTTAMLIASASMLGRSHSEGLKPWLLGAGTYAVLLCVGQWIAPQEDGRLWVELGMVALYVILVAVSRKHISVRRWAAMTAAVLFGAECLWNAWFLRADAYVLDAANHPAYSVAQQELVAQVKEMDPGVYRMDQNVNRSQESPNPALYNTIFYANEAMAYGYHGLQTYTSTYDNTCSLFTLRLGYCNGVFPTLYKRPLLPMDSLLGIKYLMSDQEHPGYVRTKLSGTHGKDVYKNPYVLPLAFVADEAVLQRSSAVDFELVNWIFNAVRGTQDDVFLPVELLPVETDTLYGIYDIPPEAADGDTLLYARCNDMVRCYMALNGNAGLLYWSDTWNHSDNVLPLGMGEDPSFFEVYLDEESWGTVPVPEVWSLNLTHFEKVVEEIRSRAAEITQFEDGLVLASCTAQADEWLLFTIPYDDMWQAQVNGNSVTPRRGAEGFLAVPVSAGENSVTLSYRTEGLTEGLCITLLALFAFPVLLLLHRRCR